ncbi:MAG: methionyl-tRNA formyltransferase [Bacteroidaceae bacterium]|nr:methionyl-tRNA formyltransferase [Bacteroidaceae bacterium]
MDKKDLRIVYLGTPDFAVESLRRLYEGGYNIVGVVTMPDKPVGRHQNHLQPSPVKTYALEHGLPLMQPANLKDEAFVEQLRALRADLQIVVAFRMLPEVVWAMPRYGTFNLHASLLPQYRGAAPINWAVMNGDRETGVTTFFLKHEIDTGDIIDQVHVPIGDDDTFGDLHDRLMLLGGDLVLKTVDALIDGSLTSRPQDDSGTEVLRPAPKIFRETCRIDWSQGVAQVHNFVRGLSPVPGAWTMLRAQNGGQSRDDMLKILRSKAETATHDLPVGTVVSDAADSLKVALRDGFLHVLELQLAGKKRMKTPDFLRGYKLPDHLQVV